MPPVIPASPDLITIAFGSSGNLTTPPQTDPNGYVNFTNGYGPDYEIDLNSGNSLAKAVERPIQNYLFNQLSLLTQFWQQLGISQWNSALSGGYNAGALVGRISASSGEWIIWRSLVDANVNDPNGSGQTTWDYVPTNADSGTRLAMPAGGTGQLLRPGGITTELILAATDFNSLVTGTFEYATDAIASGSGHSPSNYAGMVECKLWSNTSGSTTTTFGVQRYIDRTGTVFFRGMQNSAWTAWNTISITSAAIIAALGYTPANQAITITGTGLVSGGGDLSANRTLTLANIAANTVLANPTSAAAAPQAVTLANGIILSTPANTLGLGTISPAGINMTGNIATTGTCNFVNLTVTGTSSLAATTVTTTGIGGLTVASSSTNSASIVLNNTSSGAHSWSICSSGSAGPGGNGYFAIYDNTVPANRFNIDGSGNVYVPGGNFNVQSGSATISGSVTCNTLQANAGATVGTGTVRTNLVVNGGNSGTAGGGFIVVELNGSSCVGIGNASAITGGSYSASPAIYYSGSLGFYPGASSVATMDASGDLVLAGYLTAGGNVTAYQNFSTQTTSAVYSNSGASGGFIYLRPNGTGSSSGQLVIDSAGDITAAGNVTCGQYFITNNLNGVLCTSGSGGSLYLRPNGAGGTTGQCVIDSSGDFSSPANVVANNFVSATTSFVAATSGSGGGIYLHPNGAGSSTGQMSVDSSGNVTVNGNLTVNGTITNTGTTNFYTSSSDESLKSEIDRTAQPRLMHRDVPWATYRWLSDDSAGSGPIAQDAQAFDANYAPEYNHTFDDGHVERKLGIAESRMALEQAWAVGYALDAALKRIEELERRLAIAESK